MANRWLRRDAWSRIQARADSIDSEFGVGGDWYRQLARELVKRVRSGQRTDEEGFYLNGICYAASTISAVLLPGNRPRQPDELDFLHQYASLARPKKIAVDAARRLLDEEVDAVLPPKKGAAEGLLPGVHVPVHFSQPAMRTVYDEPAVIVGPSTYPQWAADRALGLQAATIVNVDVASRVVRVAETGGWAKGAVGSIEWDPSRANTWVDGLITSRYEAAQVTPRGIDVFDERISPAHEQTRAYRLDPRIPKATAQAIRLGYHRYQADLGDGVADQQSLNRAIHASRLVIADQPPEVRAGALEMFDAIDLPTGQMPVSAVRAALNAVTEDLFETPSLVLQQRAVIGVAA